MPRHDGEARADRDAARPRLERALSGQSGDHTGAGSILAPSRRGFLGGVAALGAGLVLGSRTASAAPSALSGFASIKVATHVHGSFSEQYGSWEQMYGRAAEAGIDVICQTDHDHIMLGVGAMPSLQGDWFAATSGAPPRQSQASLHAGAVRLSVESSARTPCTSTLQMVQASAWNLLRTNVAGQSLTVEFGRATLKPGAHLDIVVTLSLHPAQRGRPAGQYVLVYRFGPGLKRAHTLSANGLVCTVTAAWPGVGKQLVITPTVDVGLVWPQMLGVDNSLNGLAFSLTSPSVGIPVSADLKAVTFTRTTDASSVLAVSRTIRARYAGAYNVVGTLGQEVSTFDNSIPHVNLLFTPPRLDPKQGLTATNWPAYYAPAIAATMRAGGAVSWNHVFGPGAPGPRTLPDQTALRRQVFAQRLADRWLGASLFEVYTQRGGMPMGGPGGPVLQDGFLELADSMARYGRPITVIGANDDHQGNLPWAGLFNGWTTGVFARSTDDAALAAAANAGRAFAGHCSWTASHLDTLTAGVPMGGMTVSTATSRTVAVDVARLPAGSRVELVVGPVDYTGEDPGTSVAGSFPASALPGGTGTVGLTVDTPTGGAFVRPQVRDSRGVIIGAGQPTWFLAQPPPDGIPPDRAYAA